MKKGLKAQKGDKSPIESPESPTNRADHPHPPYHPYAYPYAAYAEHHNLYNNIYANYNMYSNPAMKGIPPNYPYYPYPPHYPEHLMDHRRPNMDSEECLSPSMVLDPVAAALFLQIPHPHIPHPSGLPRLIDSPSSHDRPQWVPNNPSAFTPKSLRAKHSPTSTQPPPGYLPDLFAEQQAHMVPQHPHLSPQHVQHPHHSPSHHSPPPPHHPSGEYLIQLPELRLPDEKDKPKLSTLEPALFRQGNAEGETPSSPTATTAATPPPPPPPPPKWQLPEWFAAERKDSQQRNEQSEAQADGEVVVPSDRTPPPLSVGE
jgi:hypothetical protein